MKLWTGMKLFCRTVNEVDDLHDSSTRSSNEDVKIRSSNGSLSQTLLISVGCLIIGLLLGTHPCVKNLFYLTYIPQNALVSQSHDLSQLDFQISVKDALATLEKKKQTEAGVRAEALATLRAALELNDLGKVDKARKLFAHALNLSPTQPDILCDYGEFLEKVDIDVITADHMYARALVLNPDHSRALVNRKRTLPMVHKMDSNRLDRLDSKRKQLVRVPDNHPGLRRLKREAYFKHIYHTVAIEGNTLTLGQTRSIIETQMTVGGKSVMEHNEILGMDAALHYINSTLLSRIGRITVEDILEIHRRVLGYVDPFGAGAIRESQVFVGDFVPPKASDVQRLMNELVAWLNSDVNLKLHTVEFAALAHYKLVTIHPFYDGNGRTSRLLMNLILMNAGFPPVMVLVGEKHEYYQHLQTANEGDVRPFVRFIARCVERTLDEYLLALTDHLEYIASGESRKHEDYGKTIIIEP